MKKLFLGLICIWILGIPLASFGKANPSSALLQWQISGRYFKYENHDIFYHDSGEIEKEVMVLVHGFPTSSWDWHSVWRELNKEYRLIAVDLLGFGFSPKPKNHDYSIMEQADLMVSLLNHVKVKKAHWVVHDYGTFIAQELLARYYPLQSLVMLNGPTTPEDIKLRPIQKLLEGPLGVLVSKFTTAFLFKLNMGPVFGPDTQPSGQDLADFWYVISQQSGHRRSHKLMHYYQESFDNRSRWVGALQKTEVPTLLLTGIADPVTGEATVEKYKDIMPHPKVVTLEGIGHYPHLEAPHMVSYHIKGFVRDLLIDSDW